jgi:hypothetical protein
MQNNTHLRIQIIVLQAACHSDGHRLVTGLLSSVPTHVCPSYTQFKVLVVVIASVLPVVYNSSAADLRLHSVQHLA